MSNTATKGSRPAIFSVIDDKNKSGLNLWPMDREKFPESKADFSGNVVIDGEKVSVVGFIQTKGDNGAKFMTLSKSTPNGNGGYTYENDYGKVNAVNLVKGEPLKADATPFVLANINGLDKPLKGYLGDTCTPDLAASLGFTEELIAQHEALVAARAAAAPAAEPEPEPAPKTPAPAARQQQQAARPAAGRRP